MKKQRKEREVKPKKECVKKQKVVNLNFRRWPSTLLWIVLIGSIAFGVFNNFTAVDTRTYIERELVELRMVDTNGIESFIFNFAKVYHAWPSDSAERTGRYDRLGEFMPEELHRLNLNMLRSDVVSSANLLEFQIWDIAQLGNYNFKVYYSVHQLIRISSIVLVEDVIQESVENYYGELVYVENVVQREEEQGEYTAVLSFFVLTVHVDDSGDMVITRNPTVAPAVGRSGYIPPIRIDDGMLDGTIRNEVQQFLHDFFAFYPTAGESALTAFVRNDALPALSVEYEFIDIVSNALMPDGDRVIAYVTVQFYDPRTFSNVFSQFELVLEHEGSWVIVENLISV